MSETHKIFKIALIGCGKVAKKHFKAITKQTDKFELCAMVDANVDVARNLIDSAKLNASDKEKLSSLVSIHTDYKQMLEDKKPDIVAITVPSGLHYEMATEAMKSGAHVLLEKPMTMRASEAKKLRDLAVKLNKTIAMGHIYRYFPVINHIQKDLSEGVFGDISHGSVIVRWGHEQHYYDQADWRGTWRYDGGALMNQSIHAIDLMYWLMNANPICVTGTLARRFRNMEAEDVGMAIFEMDNGSLCQVEGTTATDEKDHEALFYINGNKGSVRIGLRKNIPHFEIRNAAGKKINRKYYHKMLKEDGIRKLKYAGNPHHYIYADLYDAIVNQRAPLADAQSGYYSVQAVLGIYKSALTQKPVKLPLNNDFSSEDMGAFFDMQYQQS